MKCIVDFWKIENALKDAAYEALPSLRPTSIVARLT